jgi:biopolymer transport protein ExbD/biopolymer transport protein TolR
MAFLSGPSNGNGGGGRRRSRATGGALSEINIIPLVDVVLVLLIIFMLTAHVMEFGMEVNVPEVKQVRETAEDLPVVSITRNGDLFLNEKPVNINALPDEIAKRFKGAKFVYVRADKATIFDPIAQVISELNQAKLGIRLVAKPEDLSSKK